MTTSTDSGPTTAGPFTLERLSGLAGPGRLEITAPLCIGRGEDCDLPIDDPTLSWHHCTLRPEKDGLVLQDLNSSNGTWVNGQEVKEVRLHAGDRIQLGDSLFEVKAAVPATDPRPAPTPKAPVRSRTPARVAGVLGLGVLIGGAYFLWPRTDAPVSIPAPEATPIPSPLARQMSLLLETGSAKTLLQAAADALHDNLSTETDAALHQIEALMDQPENVRILAQHELLRITSPLTWKTLQADPRGQTFMQDLFKNREWMEDLLASGPLKNPDGMIRNLFMLHATAPADLQEPLYRRLASAMALEQAGGPRNNRAPDEYHFVRRFEQYVQAHRDLRLHANFDHHTVREMRFAVELAGREDHFEYLLSRHRYTLDRYYGACWSVAYLLHNMFGDSIHGPLYYRPWDHRLDWAERIRRVGGVCGSLSTYGTRASRVNGLLAMTAGQPGHCAYVIRNHDKKWVITYDVNWPTSPHGSFWGHDFTLLRLMEDIFSDPDAQLKAKRLQWMAHLVARARGPRAEIDPERRWQLYLRGGPNLPQLEGVEPDQQGTAFDFDYRNVVPREQNFTFVYEGTLTVERAGSFLFRLTSDDGSRLQVNGQPLIDHDGAHGMKPKEALIELTPGTYPWRLEYCQGNGAHGLELDVQGTVADPLVEELYGAALQHCPHHYGILEDYGRWLTSRSDTTAAAWQRFTESVLQGLEQHQEQAWTLLMGYAEDHLLADRTPADRMQQILTWHERLQEDQVADFVNYPLGRKLARQNDLIQGDPELGMQLLERLMHLHAGSGSYFSHVLEWGRERFANSQRFAELLARFYQERGGELDPDLAKKEIGASLRSAAEKKDMTSFRIYADLKSSLFGTSDPVSPGAFPGHLVSADGLLHISSTSRWDTPLQYPDVLGPGRGKFHTKKEENPSAVVRLPGPARLNGILIRNTSTHQGRQVPIRVSISSDGETWQPVFRDTTARPEWRVDLQESRPTAQYVKVEGDYPDRKDFFHLEAIHVYGEKQY